MASPKTMKHPVTDQSNRAEAGDERRRKIEDNGVAEDDEATHIQSNRVEAGDEGHRPNV
ncbi:hypothetical protein CASFOL_022910 [Castilleja foliolosa]|uniref:Uncharacterized protein n=1 Tax=Castilleja foliolosa TaxID=1961234 RepID=A0ABD3CTQ8_9LAMI